MSYSDFTLPSVLKAFDLKCSEIPNLFSEVEPLEPSKFLRDALEDNLILALGSNTEKSRSELIITPILLELRKQFNKKISFFSGVNFTIDSARGLNGNCDFLISGSEELLFIKYPVIAIVEAKKEDLIAGLGQCLAEMIAAQIFNEREIQPISSILGTVTSGTNWRFLRLQNEQVDIDLTEYYLSDLDKILGILANGISCGMGILPVTD
ncbi:hypothetical protein [Aphanothece sacrum]|uniref:TRAP transporter large permease protein YiaN n=1 Tax=Aphanothece sacrum FPU1 TaxID=1920663 RepID=A0A401IGF5_APHSA|nr:hypothetical protein [Aphanothece sacrum]GBF80301.1 TRAP transporter large permease protein YiaN [Aphanothece sacrum FPU1]GBF83707.1 TRAP transporter large permease protein YiaN [Aphanothece sacrum FPU3]